MKYCKEKAEFNNLKALLYFSCGISHS